MVVALLVAGALAVPVTGLLIRPDVRWARHGMEMFVELGRFGWYGYSAVSVLALVAALAWRGRRRSIAAVTALLVLTPIFGAIHVLVVATGFGESAGDNKPWLAAVSAAVCVAASSALVFVRARGR